MKKTSIDLIFYGIKRGSGLTKPLNLRLINNLKNYFSVRVIEIVNSTLIVNNHRSGEKNIKIDQSFFFEKSIKIKKKYIITKDYFKIFNLLNKLPDPHHDDYKTLSNLCQQLSMLSDASKLIKSNYAICMRDDIIFDLEYMLKNIIFFVYNNSYKSNYILTSCFYSNRGVCERFFIANKKVSIDLANRIIFVPSYLKNLAYKKYININNLNGEYLMRYTLENLKYDVIGPPIILDRIRAHNFIQKDSLLYNPKHLIHDKYLFKSLINYFLIKLKMFYE